MITETQSTRRPVLSFLIRDKEGVPYGFRIAICQTRNNITFLNEQDLIFVDNELDLYYAQDETDRRFSEWLDSKINYHNLVYVNNIRFSKEA